MAAPIPLISIAPAGNVSTASGGANASISSKNGNFQAELNRADRSSKNSEYASRNSVREKQEFNKKSDKSISRDDSVSQNKEAKTKDVRAEHKGRSSGSDKISQKDNEKVDVAEQKDSKVESKENQDVAAAESKGKSLPSSGAELPKDELLEEQKEKSKTVDVAPVLAVLPPVLPSIPEPVSTVQQTVTPQTVNPEQARVIAEAAAEMERKELAALNSTATVNTANLLSSTQELPPNPNVSSTESVVKTVTMGASSTVGVDAPAPQSADIAKVPSQAIVLPEGQADVSVKVAPAVTNPQVVDPQKVVSDTVLPQSAEKSDKTPAPVVLASGSQEKGVQPPIEPQGQNGISQRQESVPSVAVSVDTASPSAVSAKDTTNVVAAQNITAANDTQQVVADRVKEEPVLPAASRVAEESTPLSTVKVADTGAEKTAALQQTGIENKAPPLEVPLSQEKQESALTKTDNTLNANAVTSVTVDSADKGVLKDVQRAATQAAPVIESALRTQDREFVQAAAFGQDARGSLAQVQTQSTGSLPLATTVVPEQALQPAAVNPTVSLNQALDNLRAGVSPNVEKIQNEADKSAAKQSISSTIAGNIESLQQLTGLQSNLRTANPVTLQMPPGTPPTAANWSKNVANKVFIAASQNLRVANIQLDPPELGALQVRLQVGPDQQLNVTFNSPHGSVRDVLEQQMPRLREMLAEQGINLGESSVKDQGTNNQGERENGQDQGGNGNYASQGDEDAPVNSLNTQGTLSLVDFYA